MKTVFAAAFASLFLVGPAMAQSAAIEAVIADLGRAHAEPASIDDAAYADLRWRLSDLLALDPDGPEAAAWFAGNYEIAGVPHGWLTLDMASWLRVLTPEDLAPIDRAHLAAEGALWVFGINLRDTEDACLARTAFRLLNTPPRSELEARFAAAIPLLAHFSRLSAHALTSDRLEALSGDANPLSEPAPPELLRASVIRSIFLLGREEATGPDAWYYDFYTSEEIPAADIAALVASLTPVEWQMIEAARPFAADIEAMLGASVTDPSEVICAR